MLIKGRLQTLKCNINNCVITIANIYAPNSDNDRKTFFEVLVQLLVSYDYGDRIIMGGDFNITLEKEDKFGGLDSKSKSRNVLKEMIKTFDLVDIWRERNKGIKRFTWEQPSPLVRCRLDYFLIQNKYQKIATSVKIIPGIKSDHKIIEFTLKLNKNNRGPGFWKFNSSILKENEYTREMALLINKVWDDSTEMKDMLVRFDWLKYKIKEYTIQYCKNRAKTKRQKETEIMKELELLDTKICNLKASNEEIVRYDGLKTEVENIIEEKSRGAWVRSRVEFAEKNEKSNAYFFNKAKDSFVKKTITTLDIEGKHVTDLNDIMIHLKNFYSKLYTSTGVETDLIRDKLLNIQTCSSIIEDQKQTCDEDVTIEECWLALKDFKPNKSPGCDGLTSEFYQTFWNEIGPKLVATLNTCRQTGHLSQSQRRGVITLLEKRGKDPSKIKNWRPVSLLNVDYKILTKTLARRMANVLPQIIHNDQSGFLKGRYIGEGVRFIEDLIESYYTDNKPGIILQLDFEKAFDSAYVKVVLLVSICSSYVPKLWHVWLEKITVL